ncbi:MAG: PAS domain S-box protein [Candidatus Hodarchaeota archaeon]
MVLTIIEIGQIGVIFSQFNFGFLLLLKAKDERIKRLRISYFLASVNFILGGLVVIPFLIGISYKDFIIPFPAFFAYFGAFWALSVYEMTIPRWISKYSKIGITIWILFIMSLRLINNDLWLIFFVGGMFSVGFSILCLIIYALYQKPRFFTREYSDEAFPSPRAFTLTGIGIMLYILGPMLRELLEGLIGDNSTLFYILGVSLGVFIIGYTLLIEMKYTQTITQTALIEEKEKYQMLVEKLEEGVLLEDTEGIITFINPRGVGMLGYTEAEIVGKHWSHFAITEEYERIKAETSKRPFGISSTYEANVVTKDGSHTPVIIRATPIFAKNEEFKGVLVVYSDITELKQTEEALRRTRQQLQDMFDNIPAAVYAKDLEGRYILVNKQWRERTELHHQMVIGKTDSELFPHLPLDTWLPYEKQVLESEQVTQVEEIGHNSGRIYLATKFVLRDDEGKIYALCNTSIDITERKKIEEALRESEEKYRMLVEKMDEGVTFEDENGIITFVNPRVCQILGYKEDEIIGKHWRFIVPPQFQEISDIENEKRPHGVSSSYESGLLAKDGRYIPVIITATPIFSKKGKYQGVLVVSTDISEQKKAEETLKQVKLEEERYHAMLSHFINNDLQIIINNLDLLTLEYKTKRIIDDRIMSNIIEIASRSSKTIDTVNKIFEVLQSPFDSEPRIDLNMLNIINNVALDIQNTLLLPNLISINQQTLDFELSGDKYLPDAIYEILLFILSSNNGEKVQTPVIIKGSIYHPHFCVTIHDRQSQPISEEISSRLSGKITEKWEYQGHYIGISLTSVIMQHYGGLLKIQPLDPNGNEFHLLFPINMIQEN